MAFLTMYVCSVFQVPLLLVVVSLKTKNQYTCRESLALVQRLLCSIVPLLPLNPLHAHRDQMQVLFAKVQASLHINLQYLCTM